MGKGALLCIGLVKRIMFAESTDNDVRGSKEVKERRARTTATVYTVDDSAEKTSLNCVTTVNYCDDQSPLSALNNTGRRQKNSVTGAWRYNTVVQPGVHGRHSPLHAANQRRSAANNECLRRPETCSPAEVSTCLNGLNVRNMMWYDEGKLPV